MSYLCKKTAEKDPKHQESQNLLFCVTWRDTKKAQCTNSAVQSVPHVRMTSWPSVFWFLFPGGTMHCHYSNKDAAPLWGKEEYLFWNYK